MAYDLPAIWVKLVTRGTKSLVIGGLYREFHHLLQLQPNNTDDRNLQIDRCKRTIVGWKKAMKDSKCVVIWITRGG